MLHLRHPVDDVNHPVLGAVAVLSIIIEYHFLILVTRSLHPHPFSPHDSGQIGYQLNDLVPFRAFSRRARPTSNSSQLLTGPPGNDG